MMRAERAYFVAMKYRIAKGTETYAKLAALYKRMDAARKAVFPVLDELGAKRYAPCRGLAGGIMAVEFRTPPEGWKRAGKPGQDLYEPKMSNKEMRERLKALPVLKYEELNTIVGFKEGTSVDEDSGSFVQHRCPGMYMGKDAVLLDTGYAKYKPANADIVEILESEYRRLKEADEKRTTKKAKSHA